MTQPSTQKPRYVLRVGFAGRRVLHDADARLRAATADVLSTVARAMAEFSPASPYQSGGEPEITAFYYSRLPLLRLVTGLAEGADAVAVEALESLRREPPAWCAPHGFDHYIETELAGVIPFDVDSYRRTFSTDQARATFDEQLQACAWVMALDGIYDDADKRVSVAPTDGPEPLEHRLARERRARAYRAQGAVLLRQVDILVAAADVAEPGKAGGTLETMREAKALGIPVILIDTRPGKAGADLDVRLVAPDNDLHAVLYQPAAKPAARADVIRSWVHQITADAERLPAVDQSLDAGAAHTEDGIRRGVFLMREFFREGGGTDIVPRLGRLRTLCWQAFESRFAREPKPSSDGPLPGFKPYRARASELSDRSYSGWYRGGALLNYLLAALAVLLAALSLALLATIGHITPVWWLEGALGVLAVVKLAILAFITTNTKAINGSRWNERAVGFRFLSERLRAMYYLPLAGSLRPPTAEPTRFVSRTVQQYSVNWLSDAIVRSVSPVDALASSPATITVEGCSLNVRQLVNLDPLDAARRVRDGWILNQTVYHRRTADTMGRMHHTLERTARWLSSLVVAVVVCDLVLVGLHLAHWPNDAVLSKATSIAPWLILVTAWIPAVVASLGGVRFQSECQRLAERSAVMKVLLYGHAEPSSGGKPGGYYERADALASRIAEAKANGACDLGSWTHEVLQLTERLAADFAHEAAEWSVLYAKETPEPG